MESPLKEIHYSDPLHIAGKMRWAGPDGAVEGRARLGAVGKAISLFGELILRRNGERATGLEYSARAQDGPQDME